MELYNEIISLAEKTKEASLKIGLATEEERNGLLKKIAAAIKEGYEEIISANKIDLSKAKENGISDAMLDRLSLNKERI